MGLDGLGPGPKDPCGCIFVIQLQGMTQVAKEVQTVEGEELTTRAFKIPILMALLWVNYKYKNMNYYLDVLKKYAVFEGRAARKEYWMFALFNIIIGVILTLIGRLIGFNFLMSIYTLAILLPGLAVTARRLHDTGRSAWWILIGLIPFIGAFVLLVFATLDSQPGQNQYGANPKGETVATKGKNIFIIIAICLFAVVLIMIAISVIGYIHILQNSKTSDTNSTVQSAQQTQVATSSSGITGAYVSSLPGWQTFAPAGGGFSILFPMTPTQEVKDQKVPNTDYSLESKSYSVNVNPNETYTEAYNLTVQTVIGTSSVSISDLLPKETLVKSITDNHTSAVITYGTLQGNDVVYYSYNDAQLPLKGEVILTSNAIYYLQYVYVNGYYNAAKYSNFVNSFVLENE